MTSPPTELRRPYAFATFCTESFVSGALNLAHTLRLSKNRSPLVVMHDGQLSEHAMTALNSVEGVHLLCVPPIENPHKDSDPRFSVVFAKLHAFSLIEYEKVLFLDADALVLDSLESLFELDVEMAAAPDHGVSLRKGEFNSGVFLCRPSQELFQSLLNGVALTPSRDGGDQGYLNAFFSSRWHELSRDYNTLKRIYWYHPELFDLSRVKVLHFVGAKPWDENPADWRQFLELYDLWWSFYPAETLPLVRREPTDQERAEHRRTLLSRGRLSRTVERSSKIQTSGRLQVRSAALVSRLEFLLRREGRGLLKWAHSSATSSLRRDVQLRQILAEFARAAFEEGRAYLIVAEDLLPLLEDIRIWQEGRAGRHVWIKPRDGTARLLRGHGSVIWGARLRPQGAMHLWWRDEDESGSLRLEILRHPPFGFRNNFEHALIRDIPAEAARSIFENYAERAAASDMSFPNPIDVVVTWVDGHDPEWRKRLMQFAQGPIDWSRYLQDDELRYCLRSIFYNLPWFRQVHVVSNCERPPWLTESPHLKWVTHEEILPERALPTFNSHVIEAALHKIPGLTEHFVYLNDDMFINRPCSASKFFTRTGQAHVFLEDFGNVEGYQTGTLSLAPWQQATRKAAELLTERCGSHPTQHHRHVPYALRKSEMSQLVTTFQETFTQMETHRFRSSEDVPCISFMVHHFSLARREAAVGHCSALHVQPHNFPRFKKKVLHGGAGDFLCLNDDGAAGSSSEFVRFKARAMQRLFPLAAPWEREHSGGHS